MTFVYAATVVPRDSVGSCSSESSSTTRWRGVSSGSRSTNGTPMFPPSTAGCSGSVARRAWVSADVVVLPLVPVIPTVAAGHRRRNRSTSETIAGAAMSSASRRASRSASTRRSRGSVVGYAGLIDGEVVTRAAPMIASAGSTSGPSNRRTGRPSTASIAPPSSAPAVVDGDRRTGAGEEPRQCNARAGEAENAHGPTSEDPRGERAGGERIRIDRAGARGRAERVGAVGGHHDQRSWPMEARKRVTPMSPAMMPTIQNRSVIFSSSQPASS